MTRLRLFASIREAAGTAIADLDGTTPQEVIDAASAQFGESFAALLPSCAVMLDGEHTRDLHTPLDGVQEMALLPPVSGGAQ